MIKKLLSIVLLLGVSSAIAQNLYDDSNAASPTNESNSTAGWTNTAQLFSDNTTAQSGQFSLRAVSTNNNGRGMEYTFNAVVGQDYDITIWAREGAQSSDPAFANWFGFQTFPVTPIVGTTWTQYSWTLTATTATPTIRIFTSSYSQRFVAGNTIYVDNITIVEAGGTAGDTEAPSTITDLASSNTTTTSTQLSWSASTDNVGVTNYEVFQNGISIANTGTTTGFNVTGLTPSTSYNFTVFAEDAAGNTSTVSNTAVVNTLAPPDNQAPSAVTDLASSNTTTTSTQLTWSASTDNVGVTNYEVFQNGVSIANTGTTTGFNVTGLTPSTSYNFTVFAEDAAGNTSTVSNTAVVNTLTPADNQAPSAITDLASSNTTTTSTQLSWSASTDNVGVTNYEVFQNGISIANTGTTTGFNVTGLTPSTSYNFTVFAEDAAGNTSTVSNTAVVNTLTPADNQAPSAITDLASSNTTSTSTQLSWSASTDNVGVTNYEVFQNGVSIANTGTTTGFNVTGLTPNTSYNFTVFAEDAAGNTSAVSNTESVTTSAGNGIVDYTSENANLSTVDWTARDLYATQNVGIGTTDTQGYRLAVAGNVIAEGVKVELQGNWPDFVFEESFDLMDLEELRKFIKTNGHLPNVPSAAKVKEEGIDLGKMNANLLQKIEELTLYILSQDEEINKLKNENAILNDVLKRLELLEKKQLD
ncbi:fibronectin type III domain-containing protein [Flagellimonas iocasae]|uniref:Fibronectin type III domain-containing protein n=1 Tax=Flagellimonas iocasae TaxID=2055905 RepID=A0ABW4XTK4_9FLAO